MREARILLATRNEHKVREIERILRLGPGVEWVTLHTLGVEPTPEEDAVEAYDTFLANAHAKADYFFRLTGLPTVADDSGLVVHALDGRPGVRSKRFAADEGFAPEGGRDTDASNNACLLDRLRDVAEAERTAHYVCAATARLADGRRLETVGTCAGRILREERGAGGFGYDPLFWVPDLDATFAEVGREEKDRRSHRARAFRALAGPLRDALGRG